MGSSVSSTNHLVQVIMKPQMSHWIQRDMPLAIPYSPSYFINNTSVIIMTMYIHRFGVHILLPLHQTSTRYAHISVSKDTRCLEGTHELYSEHATILAIGWFLSTACYLNQPPLNNNPHSHTRNRHHQLGLGQAADANCGRLPKMLCFQQDVKHVLKWWYFIKGNLIPAT